MGLKLLTCWLAGALMCGHLYAEEKPLLPSRLQTLHDNYQRAMDRTTLPLKNQYRDELMKLQVELTRAGDLNGALQVTEELKGMFPETPRGDKLAKVEVENASLQPLAAGTAIFQDRPQVQWTVLPPMFDGYSFTRFGVFAGVLRFKVLSNGLVYLATTPNFINDPKAGAIDEKGLQRAGWKKLPRTGLDAKQGFLWLVFSRECKAGESFAYRTEKYAAPILLLK
jgi:hypothetical protein